MNQFLNVSVKFDLEGSKLEYNVRLYLEHTRELKQYLSSTKCNAQIRKLRFNLYFWILYESCNKETSADFARVECY